MKKIMIFIFILMYLFSIKNVFAQDQYKLTLEKQEGIYISRKGSNYNDDSQNYYIYKFGNTFAYCIQPGKHITTYNYLGMDNFVNLSISEDVKEKLELIGYYGRDYPSHDSIRYSMAAQALIWELTGVDTVTFWTQLNEKGTEIDVSKERNEIMNLVNKHQLFPNIANNITGDIKKEIIISDTNNVLSDYEIENSSGHEITISENKLHIIPKTIGDSTITLKHKRYDNLNTIIFVGSDNVSQIMGRLRFSNDKRMDIKLHIKGTKLIVKKIDEDNNIIKQSGIKFKIKNKESNEYLCKNDNCEYETNEEGFFTTNYLEYGKYEIEEIENQDLSEYLWNPNKLIVTFNENTPLKSSDDYNYIMVNFINEKVKGTLEIYKKGEEFVFQENEIIYKKKDLPNFEFNLYNEKDELIDIIKTNDNGYIKYSNLTVGKYYLIEKTKLDNYVLNNEKIYFEIKKENNKGNSILLNIDNYLKKGVLEFRKEDSITSEGISNTVIELYNENGELLVTRETDDDGNIVISNLPIGKYYLIEKEANKNYQITNEKVYFEIKENGEVVKTKMINEKKTVPVPKTNTKEGIIVHSLFGLSILIGLGRFYYDRKKTT